MKIVPYLATVHLKGPHVDFAGLSPLIALLGGATIALLVGLIRTRWVRAQLVPALSLIALGAAAGLSIWQWNEGKSIVSGALRIDDLSLVLNLILVTGGALAVLLAWRSLAAREAAHGEFHALLLTSIAGMSLLAAAQNTVALFVGLELLSIPLYVLCATELRREHSLESGLKYLIIGAVGSATLLYGLAMIYGATGATDFGAIASKLSSGGLATDPLTLTGVALCVVGLCFKASVAPFHQWTPDVYEGAPTPVTAFMAVATKAAAFGVFLRFFDVALVSTQSTWGPALAVLATITILVGNVGALGQSSLKRMLAYSSVAQAGYMLAGVVVSTQLGVRATIFYLAVYVFMNMASFAVIVARERETEFGDSIQAITRARAPVACMADDDLDARARGHPGDGGLHGEVLFDRRGRLRRLHVARRGDRDRLDDLARVLPAGDRRDVDARGAGRRKCADGVVVAARRAAAAERGPASAGGRLAGAGRAAEFAQGAAGGADRRVRRRGGDAVLRDRPAAAVRPRAPRRQRARRAVLDERH
jgi:NADH-quinone oxidoreductase subunit N